MRVVLASASPRRSDLLTQLGVEFVTAPADIDEREHAHEHPVDYVRRLAAEKAEIAAAMLDRDGCDAIVIAADTTVDVDGEILAKPLDAVDARRMLGLLSARTHAVHTGVAVRRAGRTEVTVETTLVSMVAIDEVRMNWYVGTGEPFGKAGAYALQGAGSALVDRVVGNVSNVIGLPLTVLDELLGRFGTSLTELATGTAAGNEG